MSPSVELRDLIGRAKTRDPAAIGELYNRYAGMILRYLYLRVAEYELAQDLTQEVFIKVIHGIERFEYRDEKSFLGWLYTIAANLLNSHRRRRRVISTPLDTQDDIVDLQSQAGFRLITDRVVLQQAIEQLTDDQQQVVTLRFFADMSNGEIAGLLRRTEGAVKAIQHRALQSLQRILSREGEAIALQAPRDEGYRLPPLPKRERAAIGTLSDTARVRVKPRSGD